MGHHTEKHPHHEEEYKVGKENAEKQEVAAAAATAEPAPPARESASHAEAEQRAQQEHLLKRLQDLREAGNSAWAELKTGAEHAFDELKGSVQKAINRFESVLSHDRQSESK